MIVKRVGVLEAKERFRLGRPSPGRLCVVYEVVLLLWSRSPQSGGLSRQDVGPPPPGMEEQVYICVLTHPEYRLLALSVGRSIGGGGLLKFIAVSKESTYLEETQRRALANRSVRSDRVPLTGVFIQFSLSHSDSLISTRVSM